MFNDFFIKFLNKDSILVKSKERVVYKVSSEHNTFFVSIDQNGPVAYKSNLTNEAITYYNNVYSAFNRKSDKRVFSGKVEDKGEFENGLKDPKVITFKYYVKNEQLRKLYDLKEPKDVVVFRLGNEMFLVKE